MEQISNSPEIKTHETSAEIFRTRLDAILNMSISVENINEYANTVLNALVDLTENVVAKYQHEPNFASTQTGDALENEAFAAYNLPDLGDLLDQAQQKLNQIDAITAYLQNVTRTSEIITPPDHQPSALGAENGEHREPGLVPRLATLVYILETDFDIPKEELEIVQGGLAREMRRTEPYYRVQIDDLNRIVYICDEEFNASYVFDIQKVLESEVTIAQLDYATKEERNHFITNVPGVGKRVLQIPGWRDHISELLSNDIPMPAEERISQVALEVDATVPRVSTSEIDPMRGYWTDEEGKHWGPIGRLPNDILLERSTLRDIIEHHPELQTRPILGFNNKPLTGYCLEELSELPSVTKRLELSPRPVEEGEWKGFYIDKEGKHWGRVNTIAKKIGTTNKTLQTIIKSEGGNLPTLELAVHTFYCHEDIQTLPGAARFKAELPHIATEGEEKGWYIDEQENHWGPVQYIADKLVLSMGTVSKYIDQQGLPLKRLVGHNNVLFDGYCYEAAAAIPSLAKLSAAKIKEE